MGKKESNKKDLLAKGEELIKKYEENLAMFIQIKKSIKEILKSGWEDGAPILSERRKKLERMLQEVDIFVENDDFPGENDHIH